jgi:hypothetical protein
MAIGRPVNHDADLVLVVRMDEANDCVLEYLVLPPTVLVGISLPLGERNPANVNQFRCKSFEHAISVIVRHACLLPPPNGLHLDISDRCCCY